MTTLTVKLLHKNGDVANIEMDYNKVCEVSIIQYAGTFFMFKPSRTIYGSLRTIEFGEINDPLVIGQQPTGAWRKG